MRQCWLPKGKSFTTDNKLLVLATHYIFLDSFVADNLLLDKKTNGKL